MRIAVATHDDETISVHFRTSDRYAVFDVVDGRVETLGVREREAREEAGHHDHDDTVSLLADCGAIICGGIGHRAAADLYRSGIQAVVAAQCETAPGEAARLFAAGTLPQGVIHSCCCGH
jgi:predicted Fe-Mo cluster-binding NifX family protein